MLFCYILHIFCKYAKKKKKEEEIYGRKNLQTLNIWSVNMEMNRPNTI